MATCRPYTFLTKEKLFANIDGVHVVGGKVALIPVVSSNETTYAIMVSVPAEKHNNIWHTSSLILQVVPTCLMMCRLCCIHYENVFTSWGRDHKTSLGLHALGARSWLVTRQTCSPYRMIRTALKQTSSWGDGFRIHITQREDTYIIVGVSLQKYKLHKVKAESKSLLPCRMLRLL
jgi:hypothetical protein